MEKIPIDESLTQLFVIQMLPGLSSYSSGLVVVAGILA